VRMREVASMTTAVATRDPKVIEATSGALSLKQRLSIAEAFEPNAFGIIPKVCIWDGSIRSGKTISSLLAWVVYVSQFKGGGELVVVGRTRDSISRNVFGPMMDPEIFGELSKFINYTAGAPTAKMFGRTIHILGASDVRSEAVLRGLTVGGAYVDEGTLVAEPFWVQLLGRMSVKNAQLFVTTNPDGPGHWMHKGVIKRIEELGYKRFHFKLTDNEFLLRENPEYVAQIMREFVGLWRLRFIEGLWVQAEGAVFPEWREDIHVLKPEQIPQVQQLLMVGLDFGTVHKTRAYLIGIGPHPTREKESALYTLEEFKPKVNLSTGIQSRELQDWLSFIEKRYKMALAWIAVDPAAPHFKVQLFEDGLNNVMNAHKSVEAGIMTLSALLSIENLYVSTNCPLLIENIPGYMWNPKATARGETEPIKENDDEVDAWRYGVYSSRRFWRDRISVTPARDDAPGASDEE